MVSFTTGGGGWRGRRGRRRRWRRRRHRQRHHRGPRGRCDLDHRLRAGQLGSLGFGDQVLGDLHIGFGVPPALLAMFVAGVHQLHLRAGGGAFGTGPAGQAAQAFGRAPEVFAQTQGVVDQGGAAGGVVRAFDSATGRQVAGDRDRLLQSQLREGRAVVAGVFVKAHVQPALRLGQAVAAQRVTAGVVERLDGALLAIVALVVCSDLAVGGRLAIRLQLGGPLLRRSTQGCAAVQQAEQHGHRQPMTLRPAGCSGARQRAVAERAAGEVVHGSSVEGPGEGRGPGPSRGLEKAFHRGRLRLMAGSEPAKRSASNLKRNLRKGPRAV
jgi:hypothetical protein